MSDPLLALVEALEETGAPPPGWRVHYAPDGNLRALWDASDLPGVLYRLAIPPAETSAAGRPALECARVAIDLAELRGTPWARFVDQIRKGEDFADNVLDEAEPLFNEESETASARAHLAMTAVYRMLLALDYQHTDDPVRAGQGAVESTAELERMVTDGTCPRTLTALRELLACPTLDVAVDRFLTSAREQLN